MVTVMTGIDVYIIHDMETVMTGIDVYIIHDMITVMTGIDVYIIHDMVTVMTGIDVYIIHDMVTVMTEIDVYYIHDMVTVMTELEVRLGLWCMVFNATFKNISVISWLSPSGFESRSCQGIQLTEKTNLNAILYNFQNSRSTIPECHVGLNKVIYKE
jgi:hypothetical protein